MASFLCWLIIVHLCDFKRANDRMELGVSFPFSDATAESDLLHFAFVSDLYFTATYVKRVTAIIISLALSFAALYGKILL